MGNAMGKIKKKIAEKQVTNVKTQSPNENKRMSNVKIEF